ncbi:HLA-DRB1 [Cordylochernes scorpioides]|uniref:HLA-DRB1 n=1 Tax=Cordylochernes scorpioides TaxID=51811 RepID=A0ABY6KS33_9ARAC|nr:HLA-DRB1 [Cordylochernes scorpioides]
MGVRCYLYIRSLSYHSDILSSGWSYRDKINPQSYRCPEDNGLFPNLHNCQLYFQCENGTSSVKECSPGLHFNSATKVCDWPEKAHCIEKARMFKSKLKCLLITLFDVKGLVHYEFVPRCQTINQHYYLDVLRRLRQPVRQKRLEKWHQKNWLLHHDNARPHTAVTVQLYLAKHGIALLPQPPYSPDLL